MALIYGIHAVTEALRAHPERIERITVERGGRNPRVQEIVRKAGECRVRLSFEPREWMDRRCGGERHQGVLAVTAEIDTLEVEEVLAAARTPGLVVVLDGIEDPHNLGAVLRSAEAAGADGVFVPRRRSAALGAAAVKASAGAAAHVRVGRVPNVSRLLESLKDAGYWSVGLAAAAPEPLWKIDLTVPVALVLGSEGTGLHRLVRQKCDLLASLPIAGRVGSYNVSVAAGISLYEVQRQRAQKLKGTASAAEKQECPV